MLLIGNIEDGAVKSIGKNIFIVPRVMPRRYDDADPAAVGNIAAPVADDGRIVIALKTRRIRSYIARDIPGNCPIAAPR